jgi:small GTP-binding protein
VSVVQRILGPEQEELLSELRSQLSDLRVALARFDVAPEDDATLRKSIRHLEELFLLVVVGEFNSGKSAFINALVGERVLEEGVTPTTSRIQILKHGETAQKETSEDSIDVITTPAEVLRETHIVDTPGTNAIERKHEAITSEFVPRADLVFFVTSADRPFTESERAFLERIREWGKKVVIVVNKIDILRSAEEVTDIEKFIAENAQALLGFTPEIFPVAARVAFEAKQSDAAPELARSRFEDLERYMRHTLDEAERLRLKLLNPLGVGIRLIDKYVLVIERRLELLTDDLATIEEIQRQLTAYRQEMTRNFGLRLAEVENVLHQLERRGGEFFEDTIRLTRLFDLMKKDKIKADFVRKVVGDAPQLVGQRVEETIDWLVASDLRQWQTIRDLLARRRSEHSDRVAAQMGGGFEYDRRRLLDTVGSAAQRTLESYNKEAEAHRMADSLQAAVAGTALIEVGAVGLGTAVALLASTTAADVTGLLTASLLAALGFFVIPHRRRSAKRELVEKITALREQLMGALTGQFESEVERSLQRLNEAIAPYAQFVRTEHENLTKKRTELAGIREAMARLKGKIEA